MGIEDLGILEEERRPEPGGLLEAIGLFADCDEWEEIMEEIMRSREVQGSREVSFEGAFSLTRIS